MKIGLDVHGVIDRYPKEFALLTQKWVHHCKHEVHILTGSPWGQAAKQLHGISYTHHLSIVDHHQDAGTKMELKENGWWMPTDIWNSTKGSYAKRMGLNIHFDDTLDYAPWFPETCAFIHLGSGGGDTFSILLDVLRVFDKFDDLKKFIVDFRCGVEEPHESR